MIHGPGRQAVGCPPPRRGASAGARERSESAGRTAGPPRGRPCVTAASIMSDRRLRYSTWRLSSMSPVDRNENVRGRSGSTQKQRWDNAVAESFFSSLKMGRVHETDFATHEQARAALFAGLPQRAKLTGANGMCRAKGGSTNWRTPVGGTLVKGSVFQAMTGFSHANESACTCVLHGAAGFLHRLLALSEAQTENPCYMVVDSLAPRPREEDVWVLSGGGTRTTGWTSSGCGTGRCRTRGARSLDEEPLQLRR